MIQCQEKIKFEYQLFHGGSTESITINHFDNVGQVMDLIYNSEKIKKVKDKFTLWIYMKFLDKDREYALMREQM